MTNLGHEVLTISDTAIGFQDIPDGAQHAHITIESQPVRMRDDGVAPTASVGTPYNEGDKEYYTGNLGMVKFIRSGDTDATAQVRYYG